MNHDEKRRQMQRAFVGGLYLICAWIKDYMENGTEFKDFTYELLQNIIEFEDNVQEHMTGSSGSNYHCFRRIADRDFNKFDLEIALEQSADFANTLMLDIDFVLINDSIIDIDNTLDQMGNPPVEEVA